MLWVNKYTLDKESFKNLQKPLHCCDDDKEDNSYIIILDIDEYTFREYFLDYKDNSLSRSWVNYDYYHSVILLRTESKLHATAAMSTHSFIDL